MAPKTTTVVHICERFSRLVILISKLSSYPSSPRGIGDMLDPRALHRMQRSAKHGSMPRIGLSKPLNMTFRRHQVILAKALPPKQLKVKRIMGEGSFGQVFEVNHGFGC